MYYPVYIYIYIYIYAYIHIIYTYTHYTYDKSPVDLVLACVDGSASRAMQPMVYACCTCVMISGCRFC